MNRSTVRWGAHRALERLEWIDRHVQARPPEVADRLVEELEELERFLLRVLGSAPQYSLLDTQNDTESDQ